MAPIPFKIPDVHEGFSEAHGILYLDEEFLVFEVQTLTLGMIKQDPETIKVELAALHEVEFKPGLFSDRLLIRPKKLQLLAAMPGKHEGELKLKVKRAERARVLGFIREVERRQEGR